MPSSDLISRKATIAALDDLIQQYANTLKSLARKESWVLPLVEEQLDGIKIAKDAVVAISADRVRDHLQELAMSWRARALNERAFGVDEDATPSLTCSQELVALIEQLVPPADGAEEKIASVHATAYGLPALAAPQDVPKGKFVNDIKIVVSGPGTTFSTELHAIRRALQAIGCTVHVTDEHPSNIIQISSSSRVSLIADHLPGGG